jgi:hypothetical protein
MPLDLLELSSSDDDDHGSGNFSGQHSDTASQQPNNLAHKNTKPQLLLNGYDFLPVKAHERKLKPIATPNLCELKAIFLVVNGAPAPAPAAAVVSQFRVTMQPSIASDYITGQLESSGMRLTVVSAHSNNEGSFALCVGQVVNPPSSRAGFFSPDDRHRDPKGTAPARWIFTVEALDNETVVWECSHEMRLKISRNSPPPNAQTFDVSKFAKLELPDDQRPANRPAKMLKMTPEPFTASAGSNSFASETNNHPKDEEPITVAMQECGSFEIVDAALQAKAESNERAALIRKLQNDALEGQLEESQRRCDALPNTRVELIERNFAKILVTEDLREQLSTLKKSHDGLLLEKEELKATILQRAADDLFKGELLKSVTCHNEAQLKNSNQGSTSERKNSNEPDHCSAGNWEGVMIDL